MAIMMQEIYYVYNVTIVVLNALLLGHTIHALNAIILFILDLFLVINASVIRATLMKEL